MPPKVSIIITTRNRAEYLRQTLESLGRVRVPREFAAELLVVDNASSDDTAEVVKHCKLPSLPVRYLYEPKPGQSNARNSGMAHTTGEVILFTDDDVRMPENWVEGMATPIFGGQADAVAGGVKIAPHLQRKWMTISHLSWLACTDRLNSNAPEEMVGANMAFSRGVLLKVPAFDNELGPGALGFGDDTLFTYQLKLAGFALKGKLDTVVMHHFDESRLLRIHWLVIAQRHGQSKAYFDYHWDHKPCHASRKKYLWSLVSLWKHRILRRNEWPSTEGCPEWEMSLHFSLARYREYQKESRRPRNYGQFGLRKNACVV
jgi:glycosyltransferase involved in cell wall biosynthesis